MNKIKYGNRTLYEKDGRFLRYLDGEFLGEACRAKAFAWLHAAQPYRLESTKMTDGFKGVIRDTTAGGITAEARFYKKEHETDNDVWARLVDWAGRYIGDRDLNNKGNSDETSN